MFKRNIPNFKNCQRFSKCINNWKNLQLLSNTCPKCRKRSKFVQKIFSKMSTSKKRVRKRKEMLKDDILGAGNFFRYIETWGPLPHQHLHHDHQHHHGHHLPHTEVSSRLHGGHWSMLFLQGPRRPYMSLIAFQHLPEYFQIQLNFN